VARQVESDSGPAVDEHDGGSDADRRRMDRESVHCGRPERSREDDAEEEAEESSFHDLLRSVARGCARVPAMAPA
jgi:hypothetical protein